MKDIIVIGGGASGLVSAIYAAKAGAKVCLLEKNNVCGKKILITGNGRCNYWNSDQSITHYHTRNKEVLEKILQKDYSKEVLSFFNSIGIIPRIKEGYFYPTSNQAVSIQTALIKEAQIKRTIKAHLDKELRFREKGIKVLSLFFIDEVKKYRTPDGEKGIYAQMFERCYTELINSPKKLTRKSPTT